MTALIKPVNLDAHHGLRRKTIVSSLLREIFLNRLPSGRRLITRELADRFGVSHTPIREALIELAGLGMLDLAPNKGAVVRKVTPRDVRDIYQVRRSLECEAVRGACGRVDPAELEHLRADLLGLIAAWTPHESRLIEQATEIDSRLHDLIARSCGNAFLANEINRLKILFRAFRDVSWQRDQEHSDLHRIVEESREHLAIVEAIAARRRRDAMAAMSRHILGGAAYWKAAVQSIAHDASLPGEPV